MLSCFNYCLCPYMQRRPHIQICKVKTLKAFSTRPPPNPLGKVTVSGSNGCSTHRSTLACRSIRWSHIVCPDTAPLKELGEETGKGTLQTLPPCRREQQRRLNEDSGWRLTHAAKLPPLSPTVTEQIGHTFLCLALRKDPRVAAVCCGEAA